MFMSKLGPFDMKETFLKLDMNEHIDIVTRISLSMAILDYDTISFRRKLLYIL